MKKWRRFTIKKGKPMSLLKLSGMRQMLQEALNLRVDLVIISGIEDEYRKEIDGTKTLFKDVIILKIKEIKSSLSPMVVL